MISPLLALLMEVTSSVGVPDLERLEPCLLEHSAVPLVELAMGPEYYVNILSFVDKESSVHKLGGG